MKYCVLGANGFIGKCIADRLDSLGNEVHRLARPGFDLTRRETYAQANVDNACLIDCIACVDAKQALMQETMVHGLGQFLKHVAGRSRQYVYISTASTVRDDLVATNDYVRCKRQAEALVLQQDCSKVVRLSFPFGPGEKSNRLVTRLVTQILQGVVPTIGNVTLPLTPIRFLEATLPELFSHTKRTINFTDGSTYRLREVVETIFKALGLSPGFFVDTSLDADFRIAEPDIFHNYFGALDEVSWLAIHLRSQHNEAQVTKQG